MSDSEPEENFCFFGTPLDPYDEDAFPKKKPIAMEDQIATDAHGRRRFHGAFTGGFSAGFYNTVGSLEGWTPSDFKSTRDDKAKRVDQKPLDFMDDEDLGEHGIAPQTVRATSDYATSKKRRRQVFADGPIPGEPVLETLLTSGNETVGYLLLKNLGIKDKMRKKEEELSSAGKVYGCQMPVHYKMSESITDHKQYEIPEIYKEFLENPKSNTFGLGYQGLDRTHVNLFKSSNLVVRDKNNKKFTIGGQAFGVGAFEAEDDDIYSKEDLSNYDFELTKEKNASKPQLRGTLVFGMFRKSTKPFSIKQSFPLPTIPHSFTGKHKVKRSRFEPVEQDKPQEEVVERNKINPSIRAKYLGENVDKTHTASKPILDRISIKTEEREARTNEPAVETSKQFDVSSLLMSDRFVSASQTEDLSSTPEIVHAKDTTHGTEQMREAVRMKMFGPLTRITTDWQPCALLCKRFNVPEPFLDHPDAKSRKRTKNLIFQAQKFDDELVPLQAGLMQTTARVQEESSVVNDVANNIKIEDLGKTHQEPSTSSLSTANTEKEDTKTDEVQQETIETLKPIDLTDKLDIADKTDLFKAVFLSSDSESEDEVEVKKEQDKTEAYKEAVLSDVLIPKIKPLKEGILSHVNSHIFTKPVTSNSNKDAGKKVDGQEQLSRNGEESCTSLDVALPSSNGLIVSSVGSKVLEQPVDSGLSRNNLNSSNDGDRLERNDMNKHIMKKDKHKKKEKHKKQNRRDKDSDEDVDRDRRYKKSSKHKKRKKEKHSEHKSKKKSKR